MKDAAPHWYDAITPTRLDSNGSSIVGGRQVAIAPGKSLHFDIIRKANGDFVVSCKQSELTTHNLHYTERTIFAEQVQAMPADILWSIILEGVRPLLNKQ